MPALPSVKCMIMVLFLPYKDVLESDFDYLRMTGELPATSKTFIFLQNPIQETILEPMVV